MALSLRQPSVTTSVTAVKPKLMFYTHGLVDGGGERLWACLASAFKQLGYPVIFVQDFEADDNRHNLDPEIPLYTLGRSWAAGVRRLVAVLNDESPAVALSAIGGSNIKLMAALHISKVPAVPILTYHGFNEWRTGALSFATYLGLPLLSRRAGRTVAVSAGLRKALVSRWGAKDAATVCIHNPVFVPASASAPTAEALAAREPLILSAGRFVAEKDFVTLIRAMARLKHRDAKLVILGKGPEQRLIETAIARHGLHGRVSLPGYISEPWSYYTKARLFASSSSSEPFGNVVVEAMAYGLPVASTACDGPVEILRHGEFGRIAAVGDYVQLAHAIDELLDNPGDPAARHARAQEFSFAVRVPAYEQLISDVLAERWGGRAISMAPDGFEAIAPGIATPHKSA